MEMEIEEMTKNEARQAIIDLFVKQTEEGSSSEIDDKIACIVQDFSGLGSIANMRMSMEKAEEIVEEKNNQQKTRNIIKTA
tara:strand:+ start:432 stop:674 length:243 start_codon:yes stop_codon:yes gene_type:complete